MNADQQRIVGAFVELLDANDEAWQLAADAIADARDKAPRLPDDRDSGEVLDYLLAALRAAT